LIGGHQSLKPTPQLASMIVILLSATAAVWQDVILYTNPA
jgi:exonuclease VII large subunit